jgi:hypothetical protein
MALTASKNILEKRIPSAYREDVVGTAGVQYFKGGLVGIDNTTGLLVKLTNAMTVRAVYICEDDVLAVAGEQIGVRTGIFKLLNGDTVLDTDRGKVARVGANGDDSAYKGGTDAADAIIGTIEGVDAASAPGGAGVWVNVRGTQVIATATGAANVSGA